MSEADYTQLLRDHAKVTVGSAAAACASVLAQGLPTQSRSSVQRAMEQELEAEFREAHERIRERFSNALRHTAT